MAVLTVYPKFQAFDSNGDPLTSGKVYTYVSGTSTNKTTYTDSTGGTPNANPVILDSRGEASIWLDTDAAYRFVIKTSADVTINTVDGIIGQQSVTSGGVTLGGDLNIGNYSIVDTTTNEYIKFTSTASAVNEFAVTNAATTGKPTLSLSGGDTNISMAIKGGKGTGGLNILDGNSNEVIVAGAGTASAVNEITVTNAATGNAPVIEATGGDTNIPVILKGKGTGPVRLGQATSSDIRLEADQPVADSSGNELIKFTKTASAVNEITVANAATGAGPTVSATGSDSNVDINLQTKGTGAYNFKATADSETTINLFEDTDNGSNKISIKAPASVASDKTITFQDVTGTVIVTGGTDLTVPDGGTGLSATTAYAVLCGGTTSTAALQSIASVGTANQALVSNGAATLPTFQSIHSGFTLPLQVVRKVTTETVASSTTLQNDDELTFSVAANTKYLMVGTVLLFGASANDIKFDLSLPAAASANITYMGPNSATADVTVSNTTFRSVGNGTAVTIGCDGANQFLCWIIADITIGANAGSALLQWAQASSGATASEVRAGSSLVIYPGV